MWVFDKYNAIVGAVIAALSMIFGEYWVLFALFLLFNIGDWITGWMKSKMANKENSVAGLMGIIKKVGYWLMVALAFAIGLWLGTVCEALGIDSLIPWDLRGGLGFWVLAALTVNEIRSIIENFIEAGFDVPKVLIEGLEVANKTLNEKQEIDTLDSDRI